MVEISLLNNNNKKLKTSYRNNPKFSDRKVWANSADPNQTAPLESDQVHCLLFHLHHFDKIPKGKGLASLFVF